MKTLLVLALLWSMTAEAITFAWSPVPTASGYVIVCNAISPVKIGIPTNIRFFTKDVGTATATRLQVTGFPTNNIWYCGARAYKNVAGIVAPQYSPLSNQVAVVPMPTGLTCTK